MTSQNQTCNRQSTAYLKGDLYLLGGEEGERPLAGDAGLRLGGVSPRR